MTYVPKPDPEGINSPSQSTPVRDLLVLVGGFFAIILSVLFILNLSTQWLAKHLSIEDEIRWLGPLVRHEKIADVRPPPLELIDLISKLKAHVSFPVNIQIICEKDSNAFALPGGAILITSGALSSLKSENGLAFVLGHELGHFANRDHLHLLGRRLGIFVGGLLGIGGEIHLYESFTGLIANSYNRAQEEAADDFALKLLKKIYGHTAGAEEFFEKLKRQEGLLEKSLRFDSTHPLSSERHAKILSAREEQAQVLLPKRPFKDWVRNLGCNKKPRK